MDLGADAVILKVWVSPHEEYKCFPFKPMENMPLKV